MAPASTDTPPPETPPDAVPHGAAPAPAETALADAALPDAVSMDTALPANTEIELKLAGDPAALKRLFDGPLIAGAATAKPKRKTLDSVYWDTPDRRLAKRRLALRVRRIGKRHTQTLKDERTQVTRGEWEAPLPGPTPDLSLVTAPEARERFGLILPEELAPVFATKITRRTVEIAAPGDPAAGDPAAGDPAARIEVAWDTGRVVAGTAEAPIAELELELLAGSPAALWRLAERLHAEAPLRLETASKSARGYRLADGGRPPWRKAEKLALAANAPLDTALAAILGQCLQHWATNEAAAADGRDPEGVHQMRVALRRLRSALTLFGKMLPPDTLAWLKAETKWAADGLGPARDWDVFCTEMLPPVAAALPEAEDLGVLAAAAEAERAAGYDRVRATLDDPRYTTLVLALGRWIEERGWRGPDPGEDAAALAARLAVLDAPVVETADRLLAKRHKAMLKKGRHFARLSPAARHEVRIAAKKLRYAADFFRSLYKPKKASAHIRTLAALQDDLGHLNDVATAGDLLDRLRAHAPTSGKRARAVAHGAGIVLGWYARAAEAAEPRMVADWQAYADAKPFWHKTKG